MSPDQSDDGQSSSIFSLDTIRHTSLSLLWLGFCCCGQSSFCSGNVVIHHTRSQVTFEIESPPHPNAVYLRGELPLKRSYVVFLRSYCPWFPFTGNDSQSDFFLFGLFQLSPNFCIRYPFTFLRKLQITPYITCVSSCYMRRLWLSINLSKK